MRTAYEVDSLGSADTQAAASCVLPVTGNRRSLLYSSTQAAVFSVAPPSGTDSAYNVSVTMSAAGADGQATTLDGARVIVRRLGGPVQEAHMQSSDTFAAAPLLLAASPDEDIGLIAAADGCRPSGGSNDLVCEPKPAAWLACHPCDTPFGACAAQQNAALFMNATLASLVGRGCFDVSMPQSPWPAQRRIHCPEEVQLQVTIPLSRAAVFAFITAPRMTRSAGRTAATATQNCTCGAHGTLGASSAAGTCNCVCASGWTTDPSQVR